jgi:flagellar assembly protein FliH
LGAAAPAAKPASRGAAPRGGRAANPLWGVLFAEDFDDRSPPATAEPEPEEPEIIEPVFTAEEVEAARAAGHADGLSAGLQQAEEAHRQALRVALQALAEELADAGAQARAVVEESAAALARTVLATLCAALPNLCARHGEAELRDVLRAVLPSLAHEPRVSVRVNPALLAAVTAEIETLGHELANVVALTPADTLLPGEVRIAWHHGVATRDTRSILTEIDEALGGIGLRDAIPPPHKGGRPDRAGRKEEMADVG